MPTIAELTEQERTPPRRKRAHRRPFDWDNHEIIKMTLREFAKYEEECYNLHKTTLVLVGIDVGSKHPLAARLSFDDNWRPGLEIDGKLMTYPVNRKFSFVVRKGWSALDEATNETEDAAARKRAKNIARKEAKRARDREIRERMKGGSGSKKR